MNCSICSAYNPEGAVFCGNCGASLLSGSGTEAGSVPAPPPPPAGGAGFPPPPPPSAGTYHNVPPPPPVSSVPAADKASGLAITSLVLGILSVVCCCSFITGIPAIICGWLERGKIKRGESAAKGDVMALVGIILGAIGVVLGVVWFILWVFGVLAGSLPFLDTY